MLLSHFWNNWKTGQYILEMFFLKAYHEQGYSILFPPANLSKTSQLLNLRSIFVKIDFVDSIRNYLKKRKDREVNFRKIIIKIEKALFLNLSKWVIKA
jgi:hypothetical protein